MIFPKRWIREVTKTLWGKVLIALIAIPLVIGLVIGVLMLAGLIIQWLWNATVTEIFDTNPITFWQAVMLLVLCKVLFANHHNVKHTKGDHGNGAQCLNKD